MASSGSSVRSRRPSLLLGSEVPRVFTPPLRELTPDTSRGFEAIEFAEEVLGVRLLPWQRWLLVHALETLPDGTFRFRTVVLLVARQNGKSTLMQVLSLWRMYVDAAPLVIGTAQNLDIAEEVWRGAVEMAEEVPELAAELDQVFKQPGKQYFRLTSGSRYKVQAASRRGGRGLSGDLVILDELREHQSWDAWSAVAKTTMARARAQVWAASNAGDRSSVVLAHLRRLGHLAVGDPDGLNGADVRADESVEGVDESLGVFEWSAAPGRAVTDPVGWAEANPSLNHTLPERAISAAAATDPEDVFRTEVLCQWVDSVREGAFPAGVWEANRVDESYVVTGSPVVAVDVRTGLRQSYAVVVAGASDGLDLIDVARYELGMDAQWADDYIVSEVSGICSRLGVDRVVVDKFGENAHLIPRLQDVGLTVTQLDTSDMRNGLAAFTDALVNGRVKHKGQQPLDVAVLGAEKRASGQGFLWSQARSSTDISPLRAATAAWWVFQSRDVDYDVMSSFF